MPQIDHKKIYADLVQHIRSTIAAHKNHGMRAPCLAIVAIDNDQETVEYIESMKQLCFEFEVSPVLYTVKIHDDRYVVSKIQFFPTYAMTANTPSKLLTPDYLDSLFADINADPSIDSIVVASFDPVYFDELYSKIIPHKNPDPKLITQINRAEVKPCHTRAVLQLLESRGEIRNKQIAIVLQNQLEHPSLREALQKLGAHLTICQRTDNLSLILHDKDIVIVACNEMHSVRKQDLPSECILIDLDTYFIQTAEGSAATGNVALIAENEMPALWFNDPYALRSLVDVTLILNVMDLYAAGYVASLEYSNNGNLFTPWHTGRSQLAHSRPIVERVPTPHPRVLGVESDLNETNGSDDENEITENQRGHAPRFLA